MTGNSSVKKDRPTKLESPSCRHSTGAHGVVVVVVVVVVDVVVAVDVVIPIAVIAILVVVLVVTVVVVVTAVAAVVIVVVVVGAQNLESTLSIEFSLLKNKQLFLTRRGCGWSLQRPRCDRSRLIK